MTTTQIIPALLLVGIFIWSYFDYYKWKALGKGGVPDNLKGWLMVTLIRPLKRNPFSIKFFQQHIGNHCDTIGLVDLPKRKGGRPIVAKHPVPHRQLSQMGKEVIKQTLQTTFDNTVARNKESINYALSQFEKRNNAVWLTKPETGNSCTSAKGEIAHIHHIDGSMHMVLSPSDAKKVIEMGWGELHPLAGRFIPVKTYMFIYAPRDKEEVAIIQQILAAAIKYAR